MNTSCELFPAYKCYLASIKTLLVQVWCMCTDLDTTYSPSNLKLAETTKHKTIPRSFFPWPIKKNRPVPSPYIILSSRYARASCKTTAWTNAPQLCWLLYWELVCHIKIKYCLHLMTWPYKFFFFFFGRERIFKHSFPELKKSCVHWRMCSSLKIISMQDSLEQNYLWIDTGDQLATLPCVCHVPL